jgi:hypothetical protein
VPFHCVYVSLGPVPTYCPPLRHRSVTESVAKPSGTLEESITAAMSSGWSAVGRPLRKRTDLHVSTAVRYQTYT